MSATVSKCSKDFVEEVQVVIIPRTLTFYNGSVGIGVTNGIRAVENKSGAQKGIFFRYGLLFYSWDVRDVGREHMWDGMWDVHTCWMCTPTCGVISLRHLAREWTGLSWYTWTNLEVFRNSFQTHLLIEKVL